MRRRHNPSKKLLLWGAAAVGAWYLIKSQAPPVAVTPQAGTSGNLWPYFQVWSSGPQKGQTVSQATGPFGAASGPL